MRCRPRPVWGGDGRTIRPCASPAGFAAYAPRDDAGLTAWHYGAAAELGALARPIAGRVEPLLSLGVGAFRTRRDLGRERAAPRYCLRPSDFVSLRGPVPCTAERTAAAGRVVTHTDLALSPALAFRVWVLPGLAFRADARDVIVYRGAPRHNVELATGVSLSR